MNESLREQLLSMAARDQDIRARVSRLVEADAVPREVDPGLMKEWRRIDGENEAALRQLVADHGWPSNSMVGEEAAHAAWLIAQHASDLEFQRSVLVAMQRLARSGEASPRDVAWLKDRVLVREGRRQLYGTQYSTSWLDDGKTRRQVRTLLAVDGIEDVNRRRQELGLERASIPEGGIESEPREAW